MEASTRDKIDALLDRASEAELRVVLKFLLYLLRVA